METLGHVNGTQCRNSYCQATWHNASISAVCGYVSNTENVEHEDTRNNMAGGLAGVRFYDIDA